MAKKENQQEAAVAEAVSKTEQFFQENGKKVVIALTVVVLAVVGGYLYKNFVIDSNAEKAAEMIVEAQDRFCVLPVLQGFLSPRYFAWALLHRSKPAGPLEACPGSLQANQGKPQGADYLDRGPILRYAP